MVLHATDTPRSESQRVLRRRRAQRRTFAPEGGLPASCKGCPVRGASNYSNRAGVSSHTARKQRKQRKQRKALSSWLQPGACAPKRKVNDTSTIAWSDTRLFALIGPRRRKPRVIFYALADAEESLVFRARTKPFPRYSWLAPDMSFAEYQAQTQQLLRFIVAKTGLPLLDLRY